LKILYFYQYFTTPKGSWSTRAYEFARRWVASGDQVIVVTSVYDKSDLAPSGLIDRFVVEGIDVRVINVRLSNKHGVLARLFTFTWYALFSCWYALTFSVDVVVASSGPISVGLPGLVARWTRSRPLVFEVRDLWPEGAIQLGKLRGSLLVRAARWFERVCYLSASRVVALSDGMADDIRRRYPQVSVDVVPNSCDISLFGAASAVAAEGREGSRDRENLVVYTGSLGAMDDCAQILDAASVLKKRGRDDIKLTLIGDGSEREALELRARSSELEQVSFVGLLPKVDVVGWLWRATCALVVFKNVPVLATSSPNKLFDALAAGVPVIQNTQGWIRDLLAEHECGLTVPAGDSNELADAIERLCSDEMLRDQMSVNAGRVAEELFDRDLLAERMRRILLETVRG